MQIKSVVLSEDHDSQDESSNPGTWITLTLKVNQRSKPAELIQHKFNYIVERQVKSLESIICDTKKLYVSYVDKYNRGKLLKNILLKANKLYFRSCALSESKLIEEEKFKSNIIENVNFKEAI